MTQGLIKKVAMFIMMQHDLNKGVEFYKKMGLKLKFHLKDKWAEFEIGDVKIGLCPTSHEPELIRTGVVFEVEDLKSLYENNKDWIEFFDKPHESPHGITVSFKDPNGNVSDLYQPTPEKVKDLIKKAKGEEEEDGCCGSEEACC